MLRTLDRYLLREILPPYLLSLLVFTFLLVIPPIAEVAERLLAKGIPAATIGQIILTLVPQALGVTIPMAFLIGLLIALGRLSSDREAVAFQACGVSIYRLLRPVVVLALISAGVTMWVLMRAMPDANQAFRDITYRIVASRAETDVRPRVFFEDFPNLVLYVRDMPPGGGGWQDVFLADTREAGNPDIYVARTGRMAVDPEARRVELVLTAGARHRSPAAAPDEYEVLRFDRMVLNLDPDTVFPRSSLERGDRERSIPQLRERIQQLEAEGASPHVPIMEIHKKFSIPVACLVFALLGVALGVSTRRDGKLASFILGIAVIFGYYVAMYQSEALAKGHVLSPHLAMWLPNVVLGALGAILLVRRSRSTDRLFPLPSWFERRPETPGQSAAAGPSAASRPPVLIRLPQFRVPGPTLLDGYVARAYVRVFAMAFIGLLGIFYISTFIDLSDKLFRGETTGAALLEYFWYATPQFVYYVLPVSALVSTVVTISLLTKSSELIVMKACGISLYRAAGPLFLIGAVWSGALFALEETVLAQSNRRAEALRHVIRGGSPQTFDVLNRKWIVGRDGRIYHYAYFDPRRLELNGLSIYGIDAASWRVADRTFASQVLHAGAWQARDGWLRRFDPAGEPGGYERFEERTLSIEPPEYFITERPEADRMSYRQLRTYIEELRVSGFDVVPYSVALHRKLSFPFVTIIMTLIGVPFAVTTGWRGAMYGVGVGIVLALVYWMVISLFAAIGSAGLITPVLAAWAPNVLFAAAAAWLLLTVRT